MLEVICEDIGLDICNQSHVELVILLSPGFGIRKSVWIPGQNVASFRQDLGNSISRGYLIY